MKRPFWLATGIVMGVGGTLWAEQRVRRGVEQAVSRLAPSNVAAGTVESVRQLGGRVRGAVDAGREERARREEELRQELEVRHTRSRGRHAAPPTASVRTGAVRGRDQGRR